MSRGKLEIKFVYRKADPYFLIGLRGHFDFIDR